MIWMGANRSRIVAANPGIKVLLLLWCIRGTLGDECARASGDGVCGGGGAVVVPLLVTSDGPVDGCLVCTTPSRRPRVTRSRRPRVTHYVAGDGGGEARGRGMEGDERGGQGRVEREGEGGQGVLGNLSRLFISAIYLGLST